MNALTKIDWNRLDLSTPERLHEFAVRIEAGGRAAVAEAIADHKAAGNPIYYGSDERPHALVKELPDGRRFLVEVTTDGTELVGAQIA
jgi:hypothetical protein